MTLLQIDGTTENSSKVGWYRDRVEAWRRGERVAPITIDCSLTRRCQASCAWCFAATQANSDDEITKEHFFHFLEDAAEIGVKGISLISDGESTLVDWYAEAIEYGHSLGLSMGAGSNGIRLTKDILERILPCLSYLRFNFSAGEKQRYSEIMGLRQHFFDVVLQNIKDGMEIIRRDGLQTSLNMQLVLHPRDGDQIIPFARLAKEIRPVYAVIKHCSDSDDGSIGVDYDKYPGMHEDLQAAEAMSDETFKLVVKWDKIQTGWNRKYSRCYGPNFIMQISGSGLVTVCGMKFNEKHKALHIGSITRQRFKDLWLSPRWQEVMDYIGSEHFDPRCRCGSLCLQHETNNWLWDHMHNGAEFPSGEPPRDLEFI